MTTAAVTKIEWVHNDDTGNSVKRVVLGNGITTGEMLQASVAKEGDSFRVCLSVWSDGACRQVLHYFKKLEKTSSLRSASRLLRDELKRRGCSV